jgi:mono/diheme cytochrome c family protein
MELGSKTTGAASGRSGLLARLSPSGPGARLGRRTRAAALVTILSGIAVAVSACGSQEISVAKQSPYYHGAELFLNHCSGCHTLSVVGAEGSATSIKDRLPNNGPNFNYRKVTEADVLFAIRNGGFSGAIMPQNVVVGPEAEAVAKFLSRYSGLQAKPTPSVNINLSTK